MPASDPHFGERAYPQHLHEPSPSGVARRQMQVSQVLSALTPIEQKLLLGKAAGHSIRELAAEYRYTEGTVRTKISQAYRKLRAAFPNVADFDL